MRGEQLWLEGIAREVRRRARLKEDELAMSPTIIRRVLHRGILFAPDLGDTACIRWVEVPPQIYLREVGPDSNFDAAHELGHWAVRMIGKYYGPLEERYANRLAAAILAPVPVVRDLFTHRPQPTKHDPIPESPRLADAAQISITAANIRMAEVLEDERGIATKNGNKIARGPWFETLPLVEIARGLVRNPGIIQARLRGGIDEGRTASVAQRRTGTK